MRTTFLLGASAVLVLARASLTASYPAAADAADRPALLAALRRARLTTDPAVSNDARLPAVVVSGGGSGALAAADASADVLSSCAACRTFVDALVQVTRRDGAVSHPSFGAGAAHARAVNDANAAACSAVSGGARHVRACEEIARTYGLENVDEFVQAAPDLLCEPLGRCGAVTADAAAREFDDIGDVMLGVDHGLTIAAGAAGKVERSSDKSASMVRAMKLMMAHRMYSMLNMKMMQDQQMGQQLVHAMMSKLVAAQERNREIKQEYLHFIKAAYRNEPGNCDCCEGCLPAKGGSGSSSGKGSSKH
jgi:hypothetical protein